MKKTLSILVAFLTAMFMVLPSWAFVYVDTETFDKKWEMFGPHVDGIFVNMYEGTTLSNMALRDGFIDVNDWPLDKTWYDILNDDPNVAVLWYPDPPCDRSYYEIVFNQNNETSLDPPNPLPLNPKWPCPTADVWFRRAAGYCIDRAYLEAICQNFTVQMYTEILPCMNASGWLHREIKPGGLLEDLTHPYNIAQANEILDNHHFPIDITTGWRYPDFDEDGVHDASEKWDNDDKLDFYVRLDRFRKMAGEHLAAGLNDSCKVPVQITYCTDGQAYVICMIDKNFHMYTDSRAFMGPEPDYLWDLHYSLNYWYSFGSAPPNYQHIFDPVLDTYLNGIKFGSVIHGPDFNWPIYPTPITKYINSSCWAAQERMADYVHDLPLFASKGVKAMYKTYTDVGKPYTGDKWVNFANGQGVGLNSWFSFLNGYTEHHMYGTGAAGQDMIVQYGWSQIDYPAHLNILYAEWYWDFEVLHKVYEAMTVRNPYNLLQLVPWMVNYFEQGTYLWKGMLCSKVLLSLKTGITWFDGTPVTAADIAFSLVDASKRLIAKGYAPPWWYPSVQHILSYSIIDPLTIEILLNENSAWALLWVLLAPPIIPKHIWDPIITIGDPTGFMPDLTMTGSGPFKYVSMVPGVSLEMAANKDYFRYCPIIGEFNVTWLADYENSDFKTTTYPRCRADPGYPQTWTFVTINFNTRNLWLNDSFTETSFLICDITYTIDGVPVAWEDGVFIPCGQTHTYTGTYNLSKCSHYADIHIHVIGPPMINSYLDNPWICQWINETWPIWVTIRYDIGGAMYLGKVPAPDCRVEGKDIAYVAAAYNTIPGDSRWKANADVNGDYKIDGKDIAWVSKYYGKW